MIVSMIKKVFVYLVLVFQVIWSGAVFAENVALASIINTQGKEIGTVKLTEMPLRGTAKGFFI